MTIHQRDRSLTYLAVLAVVTAVLLSRGFGSVGFIYSDDARHAMDGVFFMDFFKDFAISTPYDYVTQYYTKYPALGVGYYPPFFAVAEAPFFWLFGISITSARLCVAFFTFVAVFFWFRLVRQIYDEHTAFFSSLLLVTLPSVVKWSREVMLEMPALALIIVAVYCFYNFIVRESRWHGLVMVLATAAAGYTKQTTVFIVPLFLIYTVASGRARRLVSAETILLGILLIVLVAPLAAMTMMFGDMNVAQSVATEEPSRLLAAEQWYLYPKFLTVVLTTPLLILAAISFVWTVADPERRRTVLFIAWIVAFYITFVYIAEKIPRYAYFWVPPFTLFAALLFRRVGVRVRGVHVAGVVLLLVAAYQFSLSYAMERPFIRGYEEAAEYIAAKRLDRVFYHGSANGNGNFVFFTRQNDLERRAVVVRGDKVLASAAINQDNLLEEHATTTEEVRGIIDRLGINYFVIDRKADYGIRPYLLLRQLLETDDFVVEKTIPIESDLRWLKGEELVIYSRKVPVTGIDETLRMKLPIVGTEITTPLEQLNRFYTPGDR